MAQEATPEAAAEQPAPEATTVAPEAKADEPKVFDESYVKQLREENAKYRTRAQEAESKVQEHEDAQKSEAEKQAEETARLKAENDALKADKIRFEVATEKQLPAELVGRLQGKTKEELAADADKLLALVKPGETTQAAPSFDGGARTSSPEATTPEQAHGQAIAGLLTGQIPSP